MARNTTPNRRLNGLYPLAYLGDNPTTPSDFYSLTRDPTVNDFQGFYICDMWLNTTTYDCWLLVNVAGSVATWVKFTSGGGGNVDKIQPQLLGVDIGAPVLPLAGLVNVNNTDGNILFTNGGNPTLNSRFADSIVVNRNYTGLNGVISVSNDGTILPVGVVGVNQTSNNTAGGVMQITKQHGIGNAIVTGDSVGFYGFYGYDGTNFVQTAKMQSVSSGTIGANRVAGDLEFFTHPDSTSGGLSATQRMIINPAGAIIVNAPDNGGGAVLTVKASGTTFGGDNVILDGYYSGANVIAPFITLSKSRTNGVITTGDALAQINFNGHDGTAYVSGARILSTSSGTIGLNRVAGSLEFWTHPDSNTGVTQRVVIASTGAVTIKAPDSGVALTSIATFGQAVGGSGVAVVVDNAGLFGTVVSSAKFKENIVDMLSHSELIMKLRPVVFNYIEDKFKDTAVGLIAEEVAQVMPDLAVKNANGEMTTVKYLDLIPMLLNELQKLVKRVEELEKT